MSRKVISGDVRRIVEEIHTSIRLEQHLKVSELCLKLCRTLVKCYDTELQENDYSEKDDDLEDVQTEDESVGSRIIRNICDRLRRMSRITCVYGELIEYVALQDTVCLAQLTDLSNEFEPNDDMRHGIDCKNLVKLLRQSIILMRESNLDKFGDQSDDIPESGLHFDRRDFIQMNGLESSRYKLNLGRFRKGVERTRIDKKFNLIEEIRAGCDEGKYSLFRDLNSAWFIEFVREILLSTYPLNRFTIFIAILIVAIECNHETLQHLIHEFIDQIFHQEVNSCNLEELMQLTQVGSIWLTKRKRYMNAFKDQIRVESDLDIDENDRYQTGEEYDEIENDRSNNDSISSRSLDSNLDLKPSVRRPAKFRALLRKMIDNELLIGMKCFICSREPSGEWLEPLKLRYCPECNFKIEYHHYCSLSYEPIMITSIEQILIIHPKVETLLLINSGEWAQHMLAASRELGIITSSLNNKDSSIIEQVDIYENFERLTVLRNDDSLDIAKKSGKITSSESDNDESLENDKLDQTDDKSNTLIKFMTKLLKLNQQVKNVFDVVASDSLQAVKFLAQEADTLQLHSGDLLMIDKSDGSFQLKMFLTKTGRISSLSTINNHELTQSKTKNYAAQEDDLEPILICQSLSPISQIQIGCGQFFSSFELVRRYGVQISNSSEDASCHKCDSSFKLTELQNPNST